MPLKLELEIAHKKLLMIHGTPDSHDEHLYHEHLEERFQELAKTSWRGHNRFWSFTRTIHKKSGGALFINPGSVGRHGDGNPQAAYATITVNPFSVELIRVNYDVEAAADALEEKELLKAMPKCCFEDCPLTT